MAVFEFRSRVAYDDVDSEMSLTLRGIMGMMQEAAIAHSDLAGYSIRNVQQTRVVWMLARWRIRRSGTAKWNDELTVRTWPRTMDRVTSERDFEVLDENGSVVAIGESVWVLVSADTGRITRISRQISEAYDLTDRKVFLDSVFEPEKSNGTVNYNSSVQKRDIDSNQHVNNRVYLDYAMEALDSDIISCVSELRIYYRKQLLLGEAVRCVCYEVANGYCVDICSEDISDVRATVEFYK